jgi:hypothetical protein
MPPKRRPKDRAERRHQAREEYRDALREFTRFSHNNETAEYALARARLDAAERAYFGTHR